MGKDQGDDEKALWASVMRDVKPLDKGLDGASSQDVKPADRTKLRVSKVMRKEVGRTVKAQNSEQARDLDKRTRQRFERGKMDIDGRLDLHGMNQGQAREALHRFIIASHAQGKRKVIVITGKGRTKSEDAHEYGVLRKNVPHWLEEVSVRPLILQVQSARPEHGGSGALYVLLRRDRG